MKRAGLILVRGHQGPIQLLVRSAATFNGTQFYYESAWFPQGDPEQGAQHHYDSTQNKVSQSGRHSDFQILPQLHKKTNLYIPPLGISCLRLSAFESKHHFVLSHAINSGINLIESSSMYPDSQYIKGELLCNLPTWIQRDQLIILTKIGFQTRETNGLIQVHGHSIDLDFLKSELEKSLKRIGTPTIDFFLIQQPEIDIRLNDTPSDVFYEKMQKIFEWLESEVTAGRIQHYGVSSLSMGIPSTKKHFLSLEKLLSIAENVGGENHHFSVIQVPFNITETGYLLRKNQENDTKTLAQYAKERGIAVVTFRPLRDDTDFPFLQPTDHSDKNIKDLLEESFQNCRNLEKSYEEVSKINPKLPNYYDVAVSGSILQAHREKYPPLPEWKDIVDTAIKPHRKRMLEKIVEIKPDAKGWKFQYVEASNALVTRIGWNLETAIRPQLDALNDDLAATFPELKDNPLHAKALRIALSSGAECVSVGMRDIPSVNENIELLHYPFVAEVASKIANITVKKQ